MNGWKRLTALMLVMLLVLPMLFACDSAPKETTGAETTAAPTADETTGGAGETEPESTEPEETGADPDALSIPASELANYRIVYPQAVTEAEQMQVLYLQMAIESSFGVSLEMRDDFVRAGTDFVESEYEILVGRCARAASHAVYSTMRTKDYGYCMVDKKLVITGGSAEATVEAVKAFLENGIGDVEKAVGDLSDAAIGAWKADTLTTAIQGAGAYRFGAAGTYGGRGSSVTVNVYGAEGQSAEDIAQRVVRIITRQIETREAAWA